MSEVMGKLADDHPLMIAWGKYKAGEDFANTRQWMVKGVIAGDANTIDGQFWGAFVAGYNAASRGPTRTEP